jgi:hypothetical protein
MKLMMMFFMCFSAQVLASSKVLSEKKVDFLCRNSTIGNSPPSGNVFIKYAPTKFVACGENKFTLTILSHKNICEIEKREFLDGEVVNTRWFSRKLNTCSKDVNEYVHATGLKAKDFANLYKLIYSSNRKIYLANGLNNEKYTDSINGMVTNVVKNGDEFLCSISDEKYRNGIVLDVIIKNENPVIVAINKQVE